jgi:hypothetical protein
LKHQKTHHLLYTGFHHQLQVKHVQLYVDIGKDKSTENSKIEEKSYSSTIEVDLPHKPEY